MIGAIIFLIMLVLCFFSIFMAGYNESAGWGIVSIISFIGIFVGIGMMPPSPDTDIQHQQKVLELKLIEKRIELFDLQIEQLKLNISNK